MPAAKTTPQRFGAHLSVAGGLHLAFDAAVATGCDCLQIFVKNQKQWSAKPLTDDAIRAYQQAQRATGIKPVVAHASYLINLGSPKKEQWQRSIAAVVDELERCAALGVHGLVVHPGAHMGTGIPAGVARIAAGLDEVHTRTAGIRPSVLLETTAGQGTSIGHEIEQLGDILQRVAEPERLGVCLDTCHLFAAGYDLRDADACDQMVRSLKKHVRLSRVRCIHVNDSKGALGSRIDRHAHIGKGKIGLVGFRNLLNDPRLTKACRILETPKGKDGRGADYDKVNLAKLRKLVR
jgi:deoxyribonuclease-4